MSEQPKSEWMNKCPNQWQKQPQQPLIWWGGGGGANFPTSDDLQIFFGAFYHELVCISLELKGSDDFKSGTCVLTGIADHILPLGDLFYSSLIIMGFFSKPWTTLRTARIDSIIGAHVIGNFVANSSTASSNFLEFPPSNPQPKVFHEWTVSFKFFSSLHYFYTSFRRGIGFSYSYIYVTHMLIWEIFFAWA